MTTPINCIACEDIPAAGNSPCSVCGSSAYPPAAGEVGELVAWLRATGSCQTARMAQEQLIRAADLLERLAPLHPISVSERTPEER